MTDLKNEFSWSPSRDKAYADCPRAYWYRHYGSWGGWERKAPAEARLAYRLKKITSLAAWAGNVVHAVIEQTLQRLARNADKGVPAFEELRELSRQILIKQWFESEDRAWEEKPKRFCNLLEHYYGHEITREKRNQIRDKVFRCLQAWHRSEVLREIMEQRGSWEYLEDLISINICGVKVYVKPDFALRNDGRLIIYDWKTGKQRPEDDLQVTIYALLGQQFFNCSNTEVVLFYLDGGQVVRRTPSREEKNDAMEHIRASAGRLLMLAGDTENSVPKERCPMRVTSRCEKWCEYYELCRPEIAERQKGVFGDDPPASQLGFSEPRGEEAAGDVARAETFDPAEEEFDL